MSGITLRSWTTPVHRNEFLIATLAMAIATAGLIGTLAYMRVQAQGGTASSRRRKHVSKLRSLLSANTTDAGSCYEAALEYAELELPSSEHRDALISGLTERRDLLKYGSGDLKPLPEGEHRELMESLKLTKAKSS